MVELAVQVEFLKFLEDLHHVVQMFGLVLGIDEDIINIDNYEMMEEFSGKTLSW